MVERLALVDASLAALTQQQRFPELASFDRNYDRVPGDHPAEP